MVDHGIKPCYIFDGKPPELKGGVVSFLLLRQGRIKLMNSLQNDLQ
jgi:flap endonuclease-1